MSKWFSSNVPLVTPFMLDELGKRVDHLEKELLEERKYTYLDPYRKEPTISVPVVDEDGRYMPSGGFFGIKRTDIKLSEAFKALEEMCGVEVTYQEIKGKNSIVIYEREET